MFERFSPNLLNAISFAQEEAATVGHHSVMAKHLLLGILRLTDDPGATMLRRCGLTPTNVISEISNEPEGVSSLESTTELALSDSAKIVLKSAYEVSQDMNCSECGTQHLVLAFLKHDQTARLLVKFGGASISDIEAEVRSMSVSELPVVDVESFKKQVSAWHNRAEMARKQGNDDLVRQALEQKRKYEKLLAEL
jgi:ATP-dependent Clp protease ATP-binding subunit ClpA